MQSNEMYEVEALKRWAFIFPTRAKNDCVTFVRLLEEVADGMKYEMAQPRMIELPNDRLETYTSAVLDFVSKDPKMIMVCLPNQSADRYAAIKRLTCVNNAVPTQVIMHKTMQSKKGGNMAGVKSIATKVLIQLNCKLGGAPWMIKFPLKGVMAIGFDVTHDTNNRSNSFGALVASMDLKLKVKYFSAVAAHTSGEELSNNIAIQVVQALKQFKNLHGSVPERIFFYRDGVGDGQVTYFELIILCFF